MKIQNSVGAATLILVLLLVFLLTPSYKTFAVEESSSILMNLIPENPSANEDVAASLSSFAENLDSAKISWWVGGKMVASGTGKKTITLKAPSLGGETTIIAKILLQGGNESQVTRVIRPAETILLWQAEDSYVPPFYKGKALPAPDTFVKVVAIPDLKIGGVPVNPKNMIYSWQKDYENVQDASGFGRDFMIFKNDYLENSNNIRVTVSTTDQKHSFGGAINIGMYTPRLSFYREDPAVGTIWENAIEDSHKIKNTETILAAPYYISPKEIRQPDLVFNWFINGTPINVENFVKNLIPLKIEEGTSGNSKVKLEIENTEKIFQTVSKEINVAF